MEEYEFMPGDVFGLDVFVSSGEGKPKESEFRTTVYKREIDAQYSLKGKSARTFFAIVNKKYPTLPFSIRGFEDATVAKVGVKECLEHELLTQYPVLVEKVGEIVAQFKCTIIIQPRSTVVLAGDLPLQVDRFETAKKIEDPEIVTLLAGDLWKKDDKKEKKAEGEAEKK